MSIKSQKRKLNNKRRYKLVRRYWDVYHEWRQLEPSRWCIFAWLKWKSERPYKPKAVDEYDELCGKYCTIHCLR